MPTGTEKDLLGGKQQRQLPTVTENDLLGGKQQRQLPTVTENDLMGGKQQRRLPTVTDKDLLGGKQQLQLPTVTETDLLSGKQQRQLPTVTENEVLSGNHPKSMARGGRFDPFSMGKLLISVTLCNFWQSRGKRGNCEKIPKWGLFFKHGLFLGPGSPHNQFQWLLTPFLAKKHGPWGSF